MGMAKAGFRLTALCVAMAWAQGVVAHEGDDHAAEQATVGADGTTTLTAVKVKVTRDGASEKTRAYTVKRSSSATKLNMALIETPQTVAVVTAQQIADFGLTNQRAVLAATPGVVVQNQETERTSYSSRGSEISTFQIDGMGMPFEGYNYQTGDIDTAVYDRIEVIKGANGLTASLGEPGATVNFIRKRPTKDLQASGGISYGSWNTRRIEGDVSGSITPEGGLRGRLVVAGQDGDYYLDNYSKQKYVVSGVLEADLGDSTLLTIGSLYQNNQPQGNNWGALPLIDADGKQLSYKRSYNPIPDWVKWDKKTSNSFIELKQKLIGDWSLTATYNYVKTDEDSYLLYYYGVPDKAGNGVGALPYIYLTNENQKMADINAKGTYSLLGQRHDAVIGASWSYSVSKYRSEGTLDTPVINWHNWDGQFAMPVFTPNTDKFSMADYQQSISSVYAATRLHLNDDLRLLLGANYTEAKSDGNSFGTDNFYDRSKVLPYAALTYNLTPQYTLYTSYSTIFRPQSGADTTGKLIPAVDGRGFELGVKSSWLADKLTGSVALFDTLQKNFPLRASDMSALQKRYEVGDLQARGVELTLAGKINDQINLSAGFTHVQSEDKKTGAKTRTYMPSNVFNSLLTYQFASLPALKVGAGVTWQDKVSLDVDGVTYVGTTPVPYSGTIRQKAYALLNLMASYEINKNLALQLNADNVTNTKYLNSFPDAQGYYGAPANYTLGVKFKY